MSAYLHTARLPERPSQPRSLLRKQQTRVPIEQLLTMQIIYYYSGVIPDPFFLNASVSGLMLAKKSLICP
jgi:hypothetical protein